MKKIIAVVLASAITMSAGYTAVYATVDDTLGFNVYINDIDCSLKTPDEAQEICMNDYYNNMNFNIHDTYSETDYAVKADMFDFTEAKKAKDFYIKTDNLKWVLQLIKERNFATGDGNALDKLIDYILDNNQAYNANNRIEAVNAKIEFNNDNKKFEIIPDAPGTVIDREIFKNKIKEHIINGSGDYIIDETNFKEADIKASDPKLIAILDELNSLERYSNEVSISGQTAKFDLEYFSKFVNINYDTLTMTFDKEACSTDFVDYIAENFNTYGKTHKFKTTLGDEVSVSGGNWGLQLDKDKSKENIINYLNDNGEFELSWTHADGLNGGFVNYIEVDLSNQHVYAYENNKLFKEGNCVSGMARNHSTPAGVYHLAWKAKNKHLKGTNDDGSKYDSFVNYWMPFNGGIGLHDATWRSSFGGKIYTYNGSHGCVNLPKSVAEDIYQKIDNSYAIICYWR